MTLTLDHGPLSGDPPATNYTLDGPAHKLLTHPFPRRLRAELAGEAIFDTESAALVHETGYLPQVYVPLDALDDALLEPTDHTTHCPFKGDATYRSVRAGGRVAENAIWTYAEPTAEAPWLEGLAGIYWDSVDAWWDEDERIHGHPRDPYHRVDAVRSSRTVVVRAGEEVLAESARALIVSETGLPNRFYLRSEDVRTELLRRSETRTVCPYKGEAEHWSVEVGGGVLEDVAFSYPRPLDGQPRIADHLCFLGDGISVEVDGARVDG